MIILEEQPIRISCTDCHRAGRQDHRRAARQLLEVPSLDAGQLQRELDRFAAAKATDDNT